MQGRLLDKRWHEYIPLSGGKVESRGDLAGLYVWGWMEGIQSFHTGGEARNRTGDARIFSPALYRLSYLATGM